MTEFKPIPSCPGYYASACGRIKGKRGFILKLSLANNGYLTFSVPVGGRGCAKRILVHRAVAEAWDLHGDGDCINHIDHNKTNNNLSNLERCTKAENLYAAIKFYGKHSATKYSKEHDDLIIELANEGFSQREIARQASCSRCRVRSVLGRCKT
jgi:hypothetical protein